MSPRKMPAEYETETSLDVSFRSAIRNAKMALCKVYSFSLFGDVPSSLDLDALNAAEAALDAAEANVVENSRFALEKPLEPEDSRWKSKSLKSHFSGADVRQSGWGPPVPHWLETRADGLPWTREGCNGRSGGHFVPWPSRTVAQEELDRRRKGHAGFDDPSWKSAEYRLISVKR